MASWRVAQITMVLTATSTTAKFCQSMLFTDAFICEDVGHGIEYNQKTDPYTGCCPGTGECPSNCKNKAAGSDPNGNTICTCTDCNYEPKLKLTMDERYLKATNYFRCRHGQKLLAWDATVAANAKSWADQCTMSHTRPDGSNAYRNTPSSGENLAAGLGTPEKAVEAWYNEITDPGYTSEAESPGAGHYTALIWGSTTKLGCAMSGCVPCTKYGLSCPSMYPRPLHVCQYAERPSNGMGEYEENVPKNNTPVATEETCCASAYADAPIDTSATDRPPTTAKPTEAPLSDAEADAAGLFCRSTLYNDTIACDDGSPVDAWSGCCPYFPSPPVLDAGLLDGQCPSSCRDAFRWRGLTGKGPRQCECKECNYVRKLPMTTDEQYVKATNYYRCRHGQKPLVWDDAVAANAKTWAATCPSACDKDGVCNPSHERPDGSTSLDLTPSASENCAANYHSPEKATANWYNEIKEWPALNKYGIALPWKTTHYTALIWNATTKLGCAMNVCPKDPKLCSGHCDYPTVMPVYVCQYADEASNKKGSYMANVPESQTPSATAATCCASVYGPAPAAPTGGPTTTAAAGATAAASTAAGTAAPTEAATAAPTAAATVTDAPTVTEAPVTTAPAATLTTTGSFTVKMTAAEATALSTNAKGKDALASALAKTVGVDAAMVTITAIYVDGVKVGTRRLATDASVKVDWSVKHTKAIESSEIVVATLSANIETEAKAVADITLAVTITAATVTIRATATLAPGTEKVSAASRLGLVSAVACLAMGLSLA